MILLPAACGTRTDTTQHGKIGVKGVGARTLSAAASGASPHFSDRR